MTVKLIKYLIITFIKSRGGFHWNRPENLMINQPTAIPLTQVFYSMIMKIKILFSIQSF